MAPCVAKLERYGPQKFSWLRNSTLEEISLLYLNERIIIAKSDSFDGC